MKHVPTRLFIGLTLLLSACGAPLSTLDATSSDLQALGGGTKTTAPAAQMVLTTADAKNLLARQSDLSFRADAGSTTYTIDVDTTRTYQEIAGFGAALTESSAWLLNSKLDATRRSEVLRKLFDPALGIGLSYLRVPMGASDFALGSYTYDDVPAGQTDETLANFSVARDEQDVLPTARAIRAVSARVRFMASPWSAPAWMKTSGTLSGGSLKPETYDAYARYFLKFVRAYEASGVPIDAVTLQNEPHHETTAYPSMRFEASDAARFVGQHLGPTFQAAGLQTKLLGWDHNWDEPSYAQTLLSDAAASSYLAGSAFHCYAGDVSAQSTVQAAWPTKDVYFTECSGGGWATNFGDNLKWNVENLVIGATRNWAKTVLLWNLALDDVGGPTNGGCGNCRGVVTIPSDGSAIRYNVEYYALGHAAKFVSPGARRVASTTFGVGNVQSVAFRNPNGTRALIVLNGASESRSVKVREAGKSFTVMLVPGAVATFTWAPL
ncbi:glycoside hydrolase family 30 protein [Deinococcus yavapaiensis]|uniref:Glucosylceramidase n=1 Tax=Deinococcus yavapaiensis KR-236 TaxID=694435 RepID=A0A318SA49_9DEIO|nr:glycoside hydrolase family 30 beta sandwich domain-containing protein [Deinococcus yavapaiensis]PYE55258.1 glucosylceramidase [Deinococcus yavapaiensis KR-236]